MSCIYLLAVSVAFVAPISSSILAAEETSKSPAALIYEKALADNSKDAERQYDAYVKALNVANNKIIKALESAKAELNDPKRGKLTITERAKAIEELDVKIAGIRNGVLGESIIEGGKKSLLGEDSGVITILEGKVVSEWNNLKPFNMSTNPHDLVFAIKFDQAVSRFWFRAKPGSGSERVPYCFDGNITFGMSREMEVQLKSPKEIIKVKGTHAGSPNDFAYGPLQYKIAANEEWKDIPTSMIVTMKK